ncbi:MAG: hypothetical protein ACREBG_13640 [Pyrinomonadaceae bacterium]
MAKGRLSVDAPVPGVLRTKFPLEETNHGVAGHAERRSSARCSVLSFRWKKQTTESPGTRRRSRLKGQQEKEMFLVEERRNGDRRAEIYMRPDGLFEGRIYRQEVDLEFEVCGVTETLPRVETLVDEELDR